MNITIDTVHALLDRDARTLLNQFEWRYGQAIFNAAYNRWPKAVRRVGYNDDCYYVDSKVPRFIYLLVEAINRES